MKKFEFRIANSPTPRLEIPSSSFEIRSSNFFLPGPAHIFVQVALNSYPPMEKALVRYLAQRSDTFLLATDLDKTLDELFFQAATLLPQPYNIYPADETQPPTLGFPLAES